VGKGKKGGKGREGARERKEKREGWEGKGEGKKRSGKGILAIPILVSFGRRCISTSDPDGAQKKSTRNVSCLKSRFSKNIARIHS